MNIPLDHLYHWIRGLSHEPVSIYTFRPHGSKNITDLNFFETQDSNLITPEIICHDQEPLNYDQYQEVNIVDLWHQFAKNSEFLSNDNTLKALTAIAPYYQHLNLFAMLRIIKEINIFDRYILLHSEKNSPDVEKFSKTAEPVYYWSHGIIARDWYRFAEHDSKLNRSLKKEKTFLVYCRAWTGTREYRLKFLDLLADKNLLSHCQTSILKQDQQFDLESYVCVDSNFQPGNLESLNQIAHNTQPATASADYCADDFVTTDISVVLETVAAGTKIHLTEKTLRPIACGHPFMLAAGPGALEYLKSYGFKTFAPWVDESYDQEQDIVKRMKKIVNEMERIKNLSFLQYTDTIKQLKKIARYNKKHFFSSKFFNQIQSELIENLNASIETVKLTKGQHYLTHQKLTRKYKNNRSNKNLLKNTQRQLKEYMIGKVLRRLRQDPTTSLKQIIDQYPTGFFNLSNKNQRNNL
jgi:hypothetical protein